MNQELILKQAHEIINARKLALDSIKQRINLKTYYSIAEKLNQEKLAFEKLLNVTAHKQQQSAQYSFALDSQFFEQKFLNL